MVVNRVGDLGFALGILGTFLGIFPSYLKKMVSEKVLDQLFSSGRGKSCLRLVSAIQKV